MQRQLKYSKYNFATTSIKCPINTHKCYYVNTMKLYSTKLCAFCGEEVSKKAIKCKHCGEIYSNTRQGRKLLKQKESRSSLSRILRLLWQGIVLVGILYVVIIAMAIGSTL